MPGLKGHLAFENAPGCSRILAQTQEASIITVSIPGEEKASKHLFFSGLSPHVVAVHKDANRHVVLNRWKKKEKGISEQGEAEKEDEHRTLGLQAGLCQVYSDDGEIWGVIKPKKAPLL